MPVVIAQGNDTNTTITATNTENSSAIIQTPVATEGEFRVGPTVELRPVNDVINITADGLIELYMDNPSLNDVTLNVDARVSVPSGIHVYGEGFGQASAAGVVYGTFSVPPGSARTIYLDIKAEKTGDFYAHFSGLYWPGKNKDRFQPISLTHPFKVEQASPDPQSSKPTNPGQIGTNGNSIIWQWWWLVLIVILAIIAIAVGRR